MELRTLRYFLAVAQARTISAAAEALHVTQPTLSRQMQELEEELGKTLFLRGKRSITLTEEGTFFRKRAQEVISLLAKTTAELRAPEALLSGDIHIGGGETDAMRLIARAARRMRQDHPQVTFHIFSGNAEDVMEKIDRDLVDFGLFIEPVDLSGYEFFRLPVKDRWGVLMRKDAPLAARHPSPLRTCAACPCWSPGRTWSTTRSRAGWGQRTMPCRWWPPTTCSTVRRSWSRKAWAMPSAWTGSSACRKTARSASAPCARAWKWA